MYDPISGRFCSRDPIGYGDGNLLYGFLAQSPTTGSDPEGLCKLRSHKECCQDFKKNNPGKIKKSGLIGLVICCDGRAVPCAFPPDSIPGQPDITGNPTTIPIKDKTKELLDECIKKHENNHILNNPVTCDPSRQDTYPATIPKTDHDESECLACKASFTCLKSNLRRCRRIANCDSSVLEDYLRQSRDKMVFHCTRAGIDFNPRF